MTTLSIQHSSQLASMNAAVCEWHNSLLLVVPAWVTGVVMMNDGCYYYDC